MNKLDWYLFGNGHGMASPFYDDAFYWLKDMSHGDRKKARGQFYRLGGGFGAQLYSIEWRKPQIGERRVLAGMTFRPFHANRKGLRVEIAWSLSPPVTSAKQISDVQNAIRNWGHG